MRTALISTFSLVGPNLVLRSFQDIAGWQPPQRTYAAQAHSTGNGTGARQAGHQAGRQSDTSTDG
ncbi:hypothetical protein [Streptomyces sp. NPDC088348]|uniref:hypothetical protein n=1 Tax=Streptomyces sp. NPDC088348 TaxID=3365853 RepID=UPI00381ACA7A